jgi:large subunit ribosomal protein L25
MSELILEAQPRTLTGRKVRQLRREGLVPVVVYGNLPEPLNLQVASRALATTLQHGGFSQLVELQIEGGAKHNVLVRDIQRHPTAHSFTHVDLYAVNMLEKQHVSVQLTGIGEPASLTSEFMVLQPMDMIEISALPGDIPANIEVDLTNLTSDSPITIADLPVVSGVEYLGDPSEYVFSMIANRVATIEEEEAEAAEADVEPEVVGHGRDEDEEDEE